LQFELIAWKVVTDEISLIQNQITSNVLKVYLTTETANRFAFFSMGVAPGNYTCGGDIAPEDMTAGLWDSDHYSADIFQSTPLFNRGVSQCATVFPRQPSGWTLVARELPGDWSEESWIDQQTKLMWETNPVPIDRSVSSNVVIASSDACESVGARLPTKDEVTTLLKHGFAKTVFTDFPVTSGTAFFTSTTDSNGKVWGYTEGQLTLFQANLTTISILDLLCVQAAPSISSNQTP
jgi:hypothetical protein